MKQYVIDELRLNDYQKIKQYMDENFNPSGVEGVYCIPVEQEWLTAEQKAHVACRPHYFSLVLEENMLACELLIRTQNKIRCSCMGYAEERQRNHIIKFADNLLDKLDIRV